MHLRSRTYFGVLLLVAIAAQAGCTSTPGVESEIDLKSERLRALSDAEAACRTVYAELLSTVGHHSSADPEDQESELRARAFRLQQSEFWKTRLRPVVDSACECFLGPVSIELSRSVSVSSVAETRRRVVDFLAERGHPSDELLHQRLLSCGRRIFSALNPS